VLVAALFGMRRTGTTERPSLGLATVLWCGVLLALTHRLPVVRVWLFLLPLFLLAVAHGLIRMTSRTRAGVVVDSPLTAIALSAGIVALALLGNTVRRSDDTGAFRGARSMTAALAAELRPGDRVLAPIPTNGPLLYYFAAAGLDTALLNTPPAQTRRAYLVLEPARGRTLEWAVKVRMIDPALFAEPRLLMRDEEFELWRTVRR
jgi:hypothetical protein